jgi:hypothetical protein
MKNIRIIIALIMLFTCAIPVIGDGQVFNTRTAPTPNPGPPRGNYGTVQSYTAQTGVICAVKSNTVTPVASGKLDTLSNTDTGYVQFTFPNRYDILFDFAVTKISGTVGATALLQGSLDNATWNTITGSTTYLAGGQGASATVTNTAGTKHYQWSLPMNSGVTYPFYQVQVISTGTMTATYSGSAVYKY